MGWIVANVTGRSLVDNINEEIWSKLSTECDAYYMLDGRGIAWATGGINACARDMARFGQMMLNGGHFGGKRIVPDSVVRKIRTLGDREAFAKRPRASTYPDGAYRDYWWITNDADGAYLAKGVYGQLIYINPPTPGHRSSSRGMLPRRRPPMRSRPSRSRPRSRRWPTT